jgi:hypothetical protein
MKTKIICILVMTLLIASALPAVEALNKKASQKSPEMVGDQGHIFMQLPNSKPDTWNSNGASGIYCFEDFWDVTEPICDVHWWGKCMEWVNDEIWYPRDPDGILFNISFYEDDNGDLGPLVYSYNNVAPSITHTGILLNYHTPGSPFWCELYYFEYDLEPCMELSNGWVSISSSYHPLGENCGMNWKTSNEGNRKFLQYAEEYGWFTRYYDLALILTDAGEDPIPDLECEGSLNWDNVKPGGIVTGSFMVRNNGDPDSILHYKIDLSTTPEWGSDWTFTPNASILKTDMDWITVDVEFKAPPEKNKKYTDTLKVVNAEDSSDYCEIDIVCKNPRNKETNYPLILRLFERFPNALPILQQLLGL